MYTEVRVKRLLWEKKSTWISKKLCNRISSFHFFHKHFEDLCQERSTDTHRLEQKYVDL